MRKVEEQKDQMQTDHGISRRDVLLGLGAAAATMAYSGNTIASMPGHDHSKHSAQQSKVLDAVNNCTDKGTRCISHCLVAWTESDLELAACAKKVNEMNAICDGSQNYLPRTLTMLKLMQKSVRLFVRSVPKNVVNTINILSVENVPKHVNHSLR